MIRTSIFSSEKLPNNHSDVFETLIKAGLRVNSRLDPNFTRFAEAFPDTQIVATLSRQLSWSHFKEILPFKKPLQRDFYAEMCRLERWSVRTLRKKVDGMLYERTAISKKPEELAKKELTALREEDRLTPDLVFRDP